MSYTTDYPVPELRRRKRPGAEPKPAAPALQDGDAGVAPAAPLDYARYSRVAVFFARLFLSFIWWDLFLRRVPGIGPRVRRSAPDRWRSAARRYRVLAIRYGGVLIKLGQFLSVRVDILPPEVTSELRGLQDEVPAVPAAEILAVVAGEFGRPVDDVYARFAPEPVAAASLAQVHKATLADGVEVVVKVQRPGIDRMVHTDLAALRLAKRWLKWYRPVNRHADLDRLYEEFSRTTRAELDFVAEGRHADRFAADFAGDPGVYIAEVEWEYTTPRVLTLENVASIKIDDLAAMASAGIDRTQVARRLYDTYLDQLFIHSFVHADPHPGNLFVCPLERPAGAPDDTPTPFILIFVDFGMVAEVPEALRGAMREFAIATGTQDAHRMVQAYYDAGVLLPGADRKRLEELHVELLQRFGGVRLGQLSGAAMAQAEDVAIKYRDILFEMPFQFPVEMLFAVRAVAILSGMATTLDPDFDPWAATLPFANRLAAAQLPETVPGLFAAAERFFRQALYLPNRLDRVLTDIENGDFLSRQVMSADTARAFRRVERALDRLVWVAAAGALLIAGVIVRGNGGEAASTVMLVGAGMAFVWGMTRR
jgi:predicted unusual protein kinase regulating ubiquinone biosynthesis (AarF/ABC1/UbiB family)